MIANVVCTLAATGSALAAWWVARRGPDGPIAEMAKRKQLVLVPVSRELAERMRDYSRPVQIRLVEGKHPLLWELEAKALEPEPGA